MADWIFPLLAVLFCLLVIAADAYYGGPPPTAMA